MGADYAAQAVDGWKLYATKAGEGVHECSTSRQAMEVDNASQAGNG